MKKAQNLQDVLMMMVCVFLFLCVAFIAFEYITSMLQKVIAQIPLLSNKY
ncbi:MAG: hypothetical protein ACRDE8_11715 [Ginsengibacter sp.]